MSISRKVIKVLSILSLIGGLIQLVGGILVAVDIWDNASVQLGIPMNKAELDAVIIGGICIFFGLFQIVVGWIGIKGANQPSKIGSFLVLTLISLIYHAVCLGLSLATSTGETTTLAVYTVWNVAMLVLGYNVKKEAQRY